MYKFDLTEEEAAIRDTARSFVRDRVIPVAGELDERAEFPMEICREAFELGLMNVELDVDYGGLGLGVFENCLINEELAYGCVGVATTVTGNTLAATPIKIAGNAEQKKEYFGRLTSMTSSFASPMPLQRAGRGQRRRRHYAASTNERETTFVLNGSKQWITNATYANFYVIFATSDIAASRHKGISAFIVDRRHAGPDSVGKKEDKMGQRASNTAQIHLEDCRDSRARTCSAQRARGSRSRCARSIGRGPDIGAFACGIMRRALDESAHVRQRT